MSDDWWPTDVWGINVHYCFSTSPFYFKNQADAEKAKQKFIENKIRVHITGPYPIEKIHPALTVFESYDEWYQMYTCKL